MVLFGLLAAFCGVAALVAILQVAYLTARLAFLLVAFVCSLAWAFIESLAFLRPRARHVPPAVRWAVNDNERRRLRL